MQLQTTDVLDHVEQKTVEVCVDCYLMNEHGFLPYMDLISDAKKRVGQIEAGLKELRKQGQLVGGGDANENNFDAPCQCCRAKGVGSRHTIIIL